MKRLFVYLVLTFAFFIGTTGYVDAAVARYSSCPSTTNHCVGYEPGNNAKTGLAGGTTYYFYYPKAVKWTGNSFKFQDGNSPTFQCSSGQTPTRSIDNSDCIAASGVTYDTTTIYWCNVKYTVACPATPKPTPQPDPTPTPTPTPAPTPTPEPEPRSKNTGNSQKSNKTKKSDPTVAPTEVTTESTTAAPSNNTNIKLILINKRSISYKSSKDEYKFTVAYGIKSVEVDVDLEDPKATYKVEGNSNFDDEKPVEDIVITVTAEDVQTPKTVTIKA